MRMRSFCTAFCVAVLVVTAASTGSASTITFGTWYEFATTGIGTPAVGCSPADPGGLNCVPGTISVFAPAPPYTFVAPSEGAILTVTDAFSSGDRDEIFDFGTSIGLTPLVPPGTSCGNDVLACLSNPGMSHGVFSLGAGMHS